MRGLLWGIQVREVDWLDVLSSWHPACLVGDAHRVLQGGMPPLTPKGRRKDCHESPSTSWSAWRRPGAGVKSYELPESSHPVRMNSQAGLVRCAASQTPLNPTAWEAHLWLAVYLGGRRILPGVGVGTE